VPPPPGHVSGGFFIADVFRTDGFSEPHPSKYGELEEKAKTRRCWVSPETATLESLKRAAINASQLEYRTADVQLRARQKDDSDPTVLGTDKRVRSFLRRPTDFAVRDSRGKVCLCVSAENDEESELYISHVRWPPTVDRLLEATRPLPKYAGCFTDDDTAVFRAVAQRFATSRRLPFPGHRDDWLAQFDEEHEDVALLQRWQGSCFAEGLGGGICIVPLVSDGDETLPVDKIADYSRAFFDRDIVVLPPLALARPTGRAARAKLLGRDVTYRTHCDASDKPMPHGQFSAPDLLRVLSNRRVQIPGLPKDYRCLLGITMSDVFIGHDDDFTQGLAQMGGSSGVGIFSFLRYTAKFEAKKAGGPGKAGKPAAPRPCRLANLGAKTAVHEILHVYGLGHCTFAYCLMNGSGHLFEDYDIPHTLCAVCTAKLKVVLGPDLDLRRRLSNLCTFCIQTPGFKVEAAEFRELICFLEQA